MIKLHNGLQCICIIYYFMDVHNETELKWRFVLPIKKLLQHTIVNIHRWRSCRRVAQNRQNQESQSFPR